MSARFPFLAFVFVFVFAVCPWVRSAPEIPPGPVFTSYYRALRRANRSTRVVEGLRIEAILVPSYQCYHCLEAAVKMLSAGRSPNWESLRRCHWKDRLFRTQVAVLIRLTNTAFGRDRALQTVFFWRKKPGGATFALRGRAKITARFLATPETPRRGAVRFVRGFRRRAKGEAVPLLSRPETLFLIEDRPVEYRMLVSKNRLQREKEIALTISGLSRYYGPFSDDRMNPVHHPLRELEDVEMRLRLPIRPVPMPDPLKALMVQLEKSRPASTAMRR